MTDTFQSPADIGSEFADLDPSTDRYAKRFEGTAGEWLLARQTMALRSVLGQMAPTRVLDVGGGHGQIVRPLLEDRHSVTVHASCSDALGQVVHIDHPNLTRSTGSLRTLPYPDQSFDIVTSFRIMAHIGDWPSYLSELARVARKSVIFDFPTKGGFNALEPVLFGLKKKLEGDTRKFASMSYGDVNRTVEAAGFHVSARFGQFVLPMVVHRKLSVPLVSQVLETMCRKTGLAQKLGTPVVLRADRTGAS